MPWIQSDTTLTRNRKFRRLIRILEVSPAEGVGLLHTLWHNVMELAEDGDITKWSPEDVADYATWEKDPQQFYQVLSKEGWIDKNTKFILIHDWLDYAEKYLRSKYKTSNPKKLKQIYKKHKKAFRSSLDRLKTANIDNIDNIDKSILDKIIEHYIATQGWTEQFNQRPDMRNAQYPRLMKGAKSIYLSLDKNLEESLKAITTLGGFFKGKQLTWTLETIIKHLPRILINKDGKKKINEIINNVFKIKTGEPK